MNRTLNIGFYDSPWLFSFWRRQIHARLLCGGSFYSGPYLFPLPHVFLTYLSPHAILPRYQRLAAEMLPFPIERLRNRRFRRRGDKPLLKTKPDSAFPMLGLPIELFLMVLDQFCGVYFQDMQAFIIARAIAMQVCAFWHDVVLLNGQFWSQYHFMPYKLVADVRDWTSHFKNHFIDLTVHLDVPRMPRRALRRLLGDLGGRLSLHETAIESSMYAHLCRSLHVTALEHIALPAFLSGIRHTDGFRLESLSIARIAAPDRKNVPSFLSLPHDIFNAYLPRLRFIRLMAFVLSWTNLAYYKEAVWMVIHDVMDEAVIPSWEQLAALLEYATHLRRLSLRHFTCGPLVGPGRVIVLEQLVELDMCFCGDFLAAFFAWCYLPSITTFTATFSHPGDIVQLLWCKSILARVTTFTLSGFTDRLDDIVSMFRALPMVERINLSDAGPTFLRALTPGRTSFYQVLCPHLRELSVGDCSIRDIAEFVWMRQLIGAPIRVLKVHDLPDFDLTLETWIGGNVERFEVDPAYDFGDSWIFRPASA
ncbi:hypothetical protein C8R46DRAFT_1038266 [Mycena filopes]|nr:hypothetical protein C8R46DRAFT_1038266 [Mycena filopes]